MHDWSFSTLPWFRVNMLREAVNNKEVSEELKKICETAIVDSSVNLSELEEEEEQFPDQEYENRERYIERMEEVAYHSEIVELAIKALVIFKRENGK